MENSSKKPPESVKHRPEPPPGGGFPEYRAAEHSRKIYHPDVSPADGEADIKPDPYRGQGKKQIRGQAVPFPRRPEKSIQKPQHTAQKQTAQQPPEGNGGGQCQSRCQRLLSRGCS